MIKMIAIDIDGTVLHHQKIHPKTKEAINKAAELNIPVIIATGRNLTTIKPVAEQLGLIESNLPFVSQNGGQSFTFKNEDGKSEIHYTKTFDLNLTAEIFREASKNKIKIFAYSEDEKIAYCNKKISAFRLFMKFKSKRQKLISFTKNTKVLSPKISKFICFGKSKNMKKFREFIDNQNVSIFEFSYVTDAHSNIEINPNGVDKAFGLDFVTKKLNIDPSEVIYFGDGENDIAALKWAGKGIAMKNAKDFVKQNANDVTDLTVDEGGVGHYLFDKVFKDN